MAKLEIKYRLEGKALPPRPIKVAIGGWGGSADKKMENGSEPEPWHCPLFVDGCTHGIELLYQYETECHIVNEDGKVRIDWDRMNEPGGPAPNDFTLSVPPPPNDYLFATSLDIQAPPGYVLRTEPHPRIFRDHTQTVPAAFYGHVQSDWWPKKLFVVFKVPSPGQRHIFRKGEPYAQVLFIPRNDYALIPMPPEEQAGRRKLEDDIRLCKSVIAKNVWTSAGGIEFNDHYKVLARAYESGGMDGVKNVVREGVAAYHAAVPEGKSPAEYIELAKQAYSERKLVYTKEILNHLLAKEPGFAEAYRQMAILQWELKVYRGALTAMQRAVELAPNSAGYRIGLAELLRRTGRFDLAQRELETALGLRPDDPEILTAIGVTLSQRGFVAEGVARCRLAASVDPRAPAPHFAIGVILEQAGDRDGARTAYEAALGVDPNFTPAQEALNSVRKSAPNNATRPN